MFIRKVILGSLVATLSWFCIPMMAQTLTIRNPEVDLNFKDTPLLRFSNEANVVKGSSSTKWLAIEFSFIAAEVKESKDKYGWTNNIIVQFEILIPSSYRGRNVAALMSGEVTYWAIPMDGGKHILDGYIPPQVLDRYLRAGFKANKAFLKDTVDARVSFFSADRRLLGRYYYAKKGVDDREIIARFERASDPVAGGVIYIKNSIYPRDKTPWQFIDFNSQILMKIDSER